MECFLKFLDVLALIVQFTGACIMYQNSPQNKVSQTQLGGPNDKDKQGRRNKWLRYGFLILSIGISISLAVLIIKDFFAPTKI